MWIWLLTIALCAFTGYVVKKITLLKVLKIGGQKTELDTGRYKGTLPNQSARFLLTIPGFHLIIERIGSSRYRYIGLPKLSYFQQSFTAEALIDHELHIFTIDSDKQEALNIKTSEVHKIKSLLDLETIVNNPDEQE